MSKLVTDGSEAVQLFWHSQLLNSMPKVLWCLHFDGL